MVSATPGGLYSSISRTASTARRDLPGELGGNLGRPHPQDGQLALEVGMPDPVVQTPALERVVHVAGAVGRDHHDRRHLGVERPELGDGDRVVGQDLEQERLELVVGPVDLVDEQHRRDRRLVRDRPQQRAAHEEPLRVELVLDDGGTAGLDRAQVEELARVVPLVHGLAGVDALVALEADELASGPAGEDLGDLGLADAGFTLEQQRPLQRERQEDRGGQSLVGEVLVVGERGAHRHPHWTRLVVPSTVMVVAGARVHVRYQPSAAPSARGSVATR